MGPAHVDGSNTTPREIAGYRILDCLGRGSFATVYRAQRTGLPGNVALKVLPPDVQGEALARFKREARVASRLEHPGIVRCFDVGHDTSSGAHYLGLEYVEGSSLEDRLRAGGALPWRQAAGLLIPVAEAVAYAHGQGVIHRDLKPANVMIDANGMPRVTDFGLARDNVSVTLTTAGEVLGTPFYMAPEQIQGGKASPLFDVHALGAILYELLTSSPPYTGSSVAEVSHKILAGNPIPPSRSSPYPMPAALDAVVLQALASDAAKRTPSATAFALALREVLSSAVEPEPAGSLQPRSMLGFALGAGGGLALGLIALLALGPLTAAAPTPPAGATPSQPVAPPAADPPAPPPQSDAASRRWTTTLDAARTQIRAWNWKAAKRELESATGLARGELEHSELRRIRKQLSDERDVEEATAKDVYLRYSSRLEAWAALADAEQELEAHPESLRLLRLAAKLNAICGKAGRARELTLKIKSPHEQDRFLTELLAANTEGAAQDSPLWDRFMPLHGASWQLDEAGAINAAGNGLGEYQFGGLLLKNPLQTPPYRFETELKLDHTRPLSYVGVALGVRDSRNMVLVYLFHHEGMLEERFNATERAELLARANGKPKFLRMAAFVNGRWGHYGTEPCVFPDEGWTHLAVEVGPRSLEIQIAGEKVSKVELKETIPRGRVGIMKFYDTDASFREVKLTPR